MLWLKQKRTFLTQATSRYRLQYRGYLLPPSSRERTLGTRLHLLLLDYCDVIASLSLGENKMAASRSKMAILFPRLFATKLTTEQIIAISDILWYEL